MWKTGESYQDGFGELAKLHCTAPDLGEESGDKIKMGRHLIAALLLIAASTGVVMAQDTKSYVGTWTGRTLTGQTVQIEIPAGIAQGQPVTYFFNGLQQEPQTPVLMGERIRLSSSGSSYILLGPVEGNSMRYVRTSGQSQALATLTKQ
jgi:hypothetical protein